MHTRIKPTMTVYPCRSRAQSAEAGREATPHVWITWEAIEREHFHGGSLIADFSQPIEVDPALVKNHRYVPESQSA